MIKPKINDFIEDYKIIKYLGRGKSAYSFLVERNGAYFVYKQMHQEVVDYYQFDNKLKHELEAYKTLKKFSINIPKLISYNQEEQYLIKEYIEGMTLAEKISSGVFDIDAYLTLYAHATILESKGINIDYFPTNFIYKNKEIIYIDYEVNAYDPTWDFLHWGSIFLFHEKGFKKYLEDFKDTSLILNDQGLPKIEPVQELFNTFINYTKVLPILEILNALENIEIQPIISNIQIITGGFASKVFKIITSKRSYIVKTYDKHVDINLVKQEIKAYQNSNQYMPVCLDWKINRETSWILCEFIEGVKTMDLYQLNKDDKYIHQFTDVLIHIHEHKNHKMTSDFLVEEFQVIQSMNQTIKDSSVSHILNALKERQIDICNIPLCRIHGDYHPWNTIHKEDNIYVIDWTYRFGDFRYDVMWTYALLYRSGYDSFATTFLNRYERDIKILDREFFLVLANLRWYVNVKDALKKHFDKQLYHVIKIQMSRLNEMMPFSHSLDVDY